MSELDYRKWQIEDATDSRLEYISILLSRSNDLEEIAFLRDLQISMRNVVNKKHAASIRSNNR